MRSILLHIFKYLLWALLIIAVLLYMTGYDIQQQAPVLLGGIVVIDIVFWVTELVYKVIAKKRRKKNAKAVSDAAQKAKSAGEAMAESVKGTGVAIAESVKGTGSAIADAAGNTWGALKEKGSEMTAAIKGKLSGSEEK